MTKLSEEKELGFATYWDQRYAAATSSTESNANPTHEWFRGFDSLRPWLSRHLFNTRPAAQNPVIVHLGCGDSTVPQHLQALGYTHQICIDFSSVVIEQMRTRFASGDMSSIQWICADVRDLPQHKRSVDVAFDKGTLDAMIHGSPWSPPEAVQENTSRYMMEVARVLKDNGIFLYITYRQPHFVKPLLNWDGLWEMEMETLSDGEASFEYYGFVLRKKTP